MQEIKLKRENIKRLERESLELWNKMFHQWFQPHMEASYAKVMRECLKCH
jgi:hypothetical protein